MNGTLTIYAIRRALRQVRKRLTTPVVSKVSRRIHVGATTGSHEYLAYVTLGMMMNFRDFNCWTNHRHTMTFMWVLGETMLIA